MLLLEEEEVSRIEGDQRLIVGSFSFSQKVKEFVKYSDVTSR